MSKGYWDLIDKETNAWECSKCHHVLRYEDGTPFQNNAHYCPNCGSLIFESIEECYETEKDKRLIAAAPEMYELLKTICSYNILGASFKVWAARGEARKLLERIDSNEWMGISS